MDQLLGPDPEGGQSPLAGVRAAVAALRVDADRLASAIDPDFAGSPGGSRQPAVLQASSTSTAVLEDLLTEMRSVRAAVEQIGQALGTGLVVVNGVGEWPEPGDQLPAGWEAIALDAGRLPQNPSQWSPWAGPLPPDRPVLLLDRYERKLSVAAGGAPARLLDYDQLLPPIPPAWTGPFPSGTCGTLDWTARWQPSAPRIVTQNDTQQVSLFVRSAKTVMQFMGVLHYSWSELRFVCQSPDNTTSTQPRWRDGGVTNSGDVWQRRLTTVAW